MIVTPLPGRSGAGVRDVLRTVATSAENLRSGGGTALDRFNAYNDWANNAVVSLSAWVTPADLARLIATQRYWLLQTLDPVTRSALSLATLVDLEAASAARNLDEAANALERQLQRWRARSGQLVVADTNFYIHHDTPFDETDWNATLGLSQAVHLVVPMVAIDELDGLKRSSAKDARSRARTTLKSIDALLPDPQGVRTVQPLGSPRAFTLELLLDDPGHERLPRADDELVDRTASVGRIAERTMLLVTYDTGAAIRGRLASLDVVKLTHPS